ncbi:MAG: DEAD/DEAH box helicase, partial [Treponema sp.]|nr:DEAD/DEAH box helicase [Treponema sp.]
MKLNEIKKTITSLTGVGPSAAKLFAKLGVFTIADLLTFYPRAYDDRTGKALFNEFREKKIHCIAIVVKHEWFGYGKMKTLKLCLSDGMLEAELIAFNRSFMQTQFPVGSVVCVSGIFSVRYGKLQSTAFELIKLSSSGKISDFENTPLPDAKVFPIYHLTEGLRQKNVRKIILQALNEYGNGIDDEISESIILNRGLLSKKDAIRKIHIPENYNDIQEARKTLVYEELFSFQYTLAKRAIIHKGALPNISLEDNSSQTTKTQNISNEAFEKNLSPLQKDFLQNIPFQLTSDQKNVIFQMNCDIDKGFKEREEILIGNENAKKVPFTMARLLQGDVGSGKTLVAFFACLRIISWKGQCAIMAPTEILAKQHAEEAAKLFSPLGVRVAFLSGNVKSKGRAELLKQLQDGNIDIIIGTHALFSSAVIYN